jgi:uncharacterized protein
MPKVDFPEGSTPFFNPAAYANVKADAKKAKDKDRVRGTRPPAFSSLVEEAQTEEASASEAPAELEPSEEALRVLLDDVHQSGELLKEKPFPEEIKRYKAAVRNFLHYVVENGYTVEERMGGKNILKRKKLTLIQVVDRKLEQLAAGILAGQSSQLDILARVDEIAGLLVDLTR